MTPGEQATKLLQKIERHAQRRLTNRHEAGILIELAYQTNRIGTLDELSFLAKFSHKTFGIMKRIGTDADGYAKLSKEFGESLEQSRKLIGQLLAQAPEDEKEQISCRFLQLSPGGIEELLSLMHDLSLYKNFLIDSRAP